ncbi:MAG TPA: enoyl-CoA hydratase-related protein [Acidimicrobiales bacterium]|nr:enoyl-CoA hydratase-related protein [Acidimicrobiales bacterium]
MVAYEQVRYEVADGVALVTLNRPEKMNAWTAQLGAELGDAMAEADADDAVRAVVVTGAGRAFCAGADLSSGGFRGATGGAGGAGDAPRLRAMGPIEVRKPVIAAINGHAVGVGITWPLQCDIRLVAEEAKLAFAFVRRGVLPELASHVILPRLCGISRASELLLSGRTFLGAEAVDYGVATRALPAAEVLPAAMAMAADMAANTAPVPVALAKRLLWEGLGVDLKAFRRKEDELFAFTTRQPDAAEGPTAFFEKRPPRWTGTLDQLPD